MRRLVADPAAARACGVRRGGRPLDIAACGRHRLAASGAVQQMKGLWRNFRDMTQGVCNSKNKD
jgi:hypothetical protein